MHFLGLVKIIAHLSHSIAGHNEQTWGNCNSNCNVIVINYIFKVMEGNL